MDVNAESMTDDVPVLGQVSGNAILDRHAHLPTCALCNRYLPLGHGAGDSQFFTFCSNCNFLISGNTVLDEYMRGQRSRRRRYRSSESNFFSQQVSLITQTRQNHAAQVEPDTQSTNGDSATQAFQHLSSRTTPSQSRRWRRGLSDSESDVFDSVYGDSESNISFSGSRIFAGESDTISYSTYGGDSDASVDGRSVMENEIHLGMFSDPDTDTDIDPMNAGLFHWNSDEVEDDDEDEDDEDSEWEETDDEENRSGDRRRAPSRASEDAVYLAHEERLQGTNVEQTEGHNPVVYYRVHPARGLDIQLFRTESSRRESLATATSFLNNLPRVVIQEDHENLNDLACAICKDSLSVGTIVNQLPCSHIFHSPCILPWLNVRNSCPLCRFELPTRDQDDEDQKQGIVANRLDAQAIQQQDVDEDEDGSFSVTDGAEFDVDLLDFLGVDNVNLAAAAAENSGRQSARRRWFYFAAAPVLGIVGIALAFCLGNSVTPSNLNTLVQSSNICLDINPSIQRNNARSQRWWFPF